jgi:hypothetical protein
MKRLSTFADFPQLFHRRPLTQREQDMIAIAIGAAFVICPAVVVLAVYLMVGA